MKNILWKLTYTFLFNFFILVGHAQQSPTAAGGDATGSGGSSAYSVGQVLFNTQTGTNGSIIQGVQQPYEISVILGSEVEGIDLKMSLYPNPTADFLILSCENIMTEGAYRILDINGNVLQKAKISEIQTTVYLNDILPGTYLLNVTQKGQNIKIFKFIKN